MKHEHTIFITGPLLPRSKRRAEQAATQLNRLSRSRWQIVGVHAIGYSTLAYTLRRPVKP
jgi:hypothetical protein